PPPAGPRPRGAHPAPPTRGRGREPQELLAVGAGVRGDAPDLLLVEQLPLVGQRRDVGQVDPRHRQDAPAGGRSGGASAGAPLAAPSSRASRRARSDRVSTCTRAPCATATWATRC